MSPFQGVYWVSRHISEFKRTNIIRERVMRYSTKFWRSFAAGTSLLRLTAFRLCQPQHNACSINQVAIWPVFLATNCLNIFSEQDYSPLNLPNKDQKGMCLQPGHGHQTQKSATPALQPFPTAKATWGPLYRTSGHAASLSSPSKTQRSNTRVPIPSETSRQASSRLSVTCATTSRNRSTTQPPMLHGRPARSSRLTKSLQHGNGLRKSMYGYIHVSRVPPSTRSSIHCG
jgi:hypothetical protein